MTIKEACIAITKEIKKLPFRKKLIEFSKTDKGNLLLLSSKNVNAQFLGVLLYDSQFHELTPEEKEMFIKINNFFFKFNEMCIEPIVKKNKDLKQSLNPYSLFNYSIVKVQPEIDQCFNSLDLNPLIQAIYESSITQSILSFLEKPAKIKSDKLLSALVEFDRRIKIIGIHDTPKDLENHYFQSRSMINPSTISMNFILNILCLHEVIGIVNQLIFQALLSEHLIVLNENNIFDIPEYNKHVIGKGITLVIQPIKDELTSNAGDIIFYDIPLNGANDKGLGLIDSLNIASSQEEGTYVKFGIRGLDDNLNPYFGIIKNLK
jgi:hypothetical protein